MQMARPLLGARHGRPWRRSRVRALQELTIVSEDAPATIHDLLELRDRLRDFAAAHERDRFHSPKNPPWTRASKRRTGSLTPSATLLSRCPARTPTLGLHALRPKRIEGPTAKCEDG